jgi:hypothetical protein
VPDGNYMFRFFFNQQIQNQKKQACQYYPHLATTRALDLLLVQALQVEHNLVTRQIPEEDIHSHDSKDHHLLILKQNGDFQSQEIN